MMRNPNPNLSPVELTILMPCLNEARTVAACVREARAYLEQAGIDGEVLVADNGSTDGSIELAAAAGARVVHVPVRGYGAALMARHQRGARPLRHHGRRRLAATIFRGWTPSSRGCGPARTW